MVKPTRKKIVRHTVLHTIDQPSRQTHLQEQRVIEQASKQAMTDGQQRPAAHLNTQTTDSQRTTSNLAKQTGLLPPTRPSATIILLTRPKTDRRPTRSIERAATTPRHTNDERRTTNDEQRTTHDTLKNMRQAAQRKVVVPSHRTTDHGRPQHHSSLAHAKFLGLHVPRATYCMRVACTVTVQNMYTYKQSTDIHSHQHTIEDRCTCAFYVRCT